MQSNLLETEIEKVLLVYPGAQWRVTRKGGMRLIQWLLIMKPIPDESELAYVLADLNIGAEISISQYGKISHSKRQCAVPFEEHPTLLRCLKIPQRDYWVNLSYQQRVSNMFAPMQPRAQIVMPEISSLTYPNHPHIYCGETPYGVQSWACPLSPQDRSWNWQRGGIISYLDQVALWLLKTEVWIRTGAGIARLGTWIGSHTPHLPIDHVRGVKLSDPCWCGSGRCYMDCHMQRDALGAVADNVFQRIAGNFQQKKDEGYKSI